MIKKRKILVILFIAIFLSFLKNSYAQEIIYTKDITIQVINNNPYLMRIKVDWDNIIDKKDFLYYKISHSIYSSAIAYPHDVIWYSDDITKNVASDNISWEYKPNLEWKTNYYRACILTLSNKVYCSKNDYWINFEKEKLNTKSISQDEWQKIKNISYSSIMDSEISSIKTSNSTLQNSPEVLEKLYSIKEQIQNHINRNSQILSNESVKNDEKENIIVENDKLKKSMNEVDGLLNQLENLKEKNQKISLINMKLYLIVFLLTLSLIMFLILFVLTRKSKNNDDKNVKILQILKNWNEYSIEYDWIYNKWVKVLQNTKNSIKSWVYSFVRSSNLFLKTRWVLDDLENMQINVPDLSVSGNTIFKLFINDSIKKKLFNQKEALVIKTDEQEIPWEIMHNWENFLSLQIPISRQIMTREIIKRNICPKNKLPKFLFIVNPTIDLDETEKEVELIIRKIIWKAYIKVLKWKNANLINVIHEFWKDDYDIIHFSWHSYFDEKNPDESWLVLASWEILSNTEIKRLLEWSPLIFLNACSSWVWISDYEDYFNNTWEDTIWLSTSFIIWWARWVISTMWPVNDVSASEFALSFYLKFLQKYNIWKSLLNAKKESFLKNKKDPTWASFVYYWDPNLKINIK